MRKTEGFSVVSTRKNDRPHYVYELRRTSSGPGPTRYIGVRTAKNGDPEKDDYWGSNSKIDKERAAGATFSKTILATFETRNDAEFWEAELHWQNMVGKDPHFYNVTAQLIEEKMDLLFPRGRYISPDGEHLWFKKGFEPVGWRHDPAKWAQFKIPTDDEDELCFGNGFAYTYEGLEFPEWQFHKYYPDKLAFGVDKPRHCYDPYVELDFRNDILDFSYFPTGAQPSGWVPGIHPRQLMDANIPNGWAVYFHVAPKIFNSAYFPKREVPNGWVDAETYEELSKVPSANRPVTNAINSEFRHIFRIAECKADAASRLRSLRMNAFSQLANLNWKAFASELDIDLTEDEKTLVLKVIGNDPVALRLNNLFYYPAAADDADDEEFRRMQIVTGVRTVVLENRYTRSAMEWTKTIASLDLCDEEKALAYSIIRDMVQIYKFSETDTPLPEFYEDLLEQSSPTFNPIEDHLSAILVEATRLHKDAMSQLDSPKSDPIPQLREAKRLLAEVEILASDAASYVDATQMDTTLADLHRQQGQVDAMLIQVEARKRHTNYSAWGWIGLAALLVIVAVWVV